jgi:hypothetical protein
MPYFLFRLLDFTKTLTFGANQRQTDPDRFFGVEESLPVLLPHHTARLMVVVLPCAQEDMSL